MLQSSYLVIIILTRLGHIHILRSERVIVPFWDIRGRIGEYDFNQLYNAHLFLWIKRCQIGSYSYWGFCSY